MADSSNVQHLDTNKFSSTIATFKTGIARYLFTTAGGIDFV